MLFTTDNYNFTIMYVLSYFVICAFLINECKTLDAITGKRSLDLYDDVTKTRIFSNECVFW